MVFKQILRVEFSETHTDNSAVRYIFLKKLFEAL